MCVHFKNENVQWLKSTNYKLIVILNQEFISMVTCNDCLENALLCVQLHLPIGKKSEWRAFPLTEYLCSPYQHMNTCILLVHSLLVMSMVITSSWLVTVMHCSVLECFLQVGTRDHNITRMVHISDRVHIWAHMVIKRLLNSSMQDCL